MIIPKVTVPWRCWVRVSRIQGGFRRYSVGSSTCRGQSGSIVMLVLFTCLAVAVIIQGLCAVNLCAERAAVDEAVGRLRLEEKDQGLALMRVRALLNWEALSWTTVRDGEGAVTGSLSELEDGAGWVLNATVRQDPAISRLTTSAWIERARDGVDLPFAVVAAGAIEGSPDRDLPWISADSPSSAVPSEPTLVAATAYVSTMPEAPLLGEGCSLEALGGTWSLDPGWLKMRSYTELEDWIDTAAAGSEGETAGPLPGVAPGQQVTVLNGQTGWTLRLPEDCRGSEDLPILVIVTGGAALDAQNAGELWGVIVVDDGTLWLDGTSVHGAVFVSDTVHLGETGRIVFSSSVLRWATDRSLIRTRLVPGTRKEGTE